MVSSHQLLNACMHSHLDYLMEGDFSETELLAVAYSLEQKASAIKKALQGRDWEYRNNLFEEVLLSHFKSRGLL